MGHLRLGRLPKHRRWGAVIQLLDEAPINHADVARAVVQAADDRLVRLSKDKTLAYCFWLLTTIAWSSRSPDFAAYLSNLRIRVDGDSSALSLISQLTDRVRTEVAQHPESGPFGELASLAFRRALSETVGVQGTGLFAATVEDTRAAFRNYSTRGQFGVLARRFFGDFFSRTLRYFVDKELSNHIGSDHALLNVGQSREFEQALDVYARQSAKIMEDFAPGWYSKHNWESKGRVTLQEAQRFVAVALRKLRMELTSEEPSV